MVGRWNICSLSAHLPKSQKKIRETRYFTRFSDCMKKNIKYILLFYYCILYFIRKNFLYKHLFQINLFEYTSGCGAHANRRRPMAPAAPVHHNQQQTQQIRAKVATAVAGGGGVSHNDGRRSGGGGQLQQRVQLQQHTLAGGGVVHQHQQVNDTKFMDRICIINHTIL